MKKKFKVDYLKEELGLPWYSDIVVEDKIVDTSRWSAIHEIVFKVGRKYWKTWYSCGLTELQYERPWEEQEEVECEEVELKEIVVKQWVPKEETNN